MSPFESWCSTRPSNPTDTGASMEGYSTLALADGVMRHMSSRKLVEHGNNTYRYFQTLGDPDDKVGRPFVSHGYLMYPD